MPPLAPRGSVEGFQVTKGPAPDTVKQPSTAALQLNGKGPKAAEIPDPLPAPGGSVRARATAWEQQQQQQQQQQQPAIRVPVWVPPQRAFSTTDAVLQWLNEERRARPSQLSSSSLTGAVPCTVQVAGDEVPVQDLRIVSCALKLRQCCIIDAAGQGAVSEAGPGENTPWVWPHQCIARQWLLTILGRRISLQP